MYLWTAVMPDGDEIRVQMAMNNVAKIGTLAMAFSAIGRLGNYDPDLFVRTGGCDMSCTPIDSGVLFLLIGGGLFGGFMIKRRRETELMPLAAK